MKKMSTLAIASILEELRCMDGELFKAEICQRLFLCLKNQASETLETAYTKTPSEYSKVLEMYRSWPVEVSREELFTLQQQAGGTEELQSAWVAVSLHWVRLHKKADGSGKMSVKIKTPDPRDLLKNFFVSLCSKTWCIKGDLWSMDPVKQDFVFREVFRQSVANSVHFLQEGTAEARAEDKSSESSKLLLQEGKYSSSKEESNKKKNYHPLPFLPEHKLSPQHEQNLSPLADEEEAPVHEPKKSEEKPEKEEKETISKEETLPLPTEKEDEKDETLPLKYEHEDEDDIGPDDSVSQFFSDTGDKKTPPVFPSQTTPPPKRYADAGTVMYSSAPRRVLVKPITLNLENPIQNNLEE